MKKIGGGGGVIEVYYGIVQVVNESAMFLHLYFWSDNRL